MTGHQSAGPKWSRWDFGAFQQHDPPFLPGLHTTLALHFALLTICLALHFQIKGVCTPFSFTYALSMVSVTSVPTCLHMVDREHTEKRGGGGTQENQGVVQVSSSRQFRSLDLYNHS